MIKAVLFDMDGTVFDTEAIYRRCWFRAAKDVGFDEDHRYGRDGSRRRP